MNELGWVAAGIAGATVMMLASRVAVRESAALAHALRLPPFLVGLTVVSLGTDTPELVNSLVSCSMGHGDINVGDSIGSVYTQATLILGLFPLAAGAAQRFARREVLVLGALTLAALAMTSALTADAFLSRGDAATLVLVWAAFTWIASRFAATSVQDPGPRADGRRALLLTLRALGAFAVVGGAAAVLVRSVSALSMALGVPEFVLSFFGASLGTSLPELVTEVTALRRRESQLALGNVLGACLMDASLSVAIGPLFFPVAVDAPLALRGTLVAFLAVALATLLLGLRGLHDRWSGIALALAYLAAYLAYA